MIQIFVQCRIDSQRLPGKCFLEYKGKTILEHVLGQMPFEPYLLTPDHALVQWAHQKGRQVLLVDTKDQDLLRGFRQAADILDADPIVRVTADCPMLIPDIVQDVIDQHEYAKPDLTYNSWFDCGDGYDVEVFTRKALDQAYDYARGEQREHVTMWMRENLVCHKADPVESGYSINYIDDYLRLIGVDNGRTS